MPWTSADRRLRRWSAPATSTRRDVRLPAIQCRDLARLRLHQLRCRRRAAGFAPAEVAKVIAPWDPATRRGPAPGQGDRPLPVELEGDDREQQRCLSRQQAACVVRCTTSSPANWPEFPRTCPRRRGLLPLQRHAPPRRQLQPDAKGDHADLPRPGRGRSAAASSSPMCRRPCPFTGFTPPRPDHCTSFCAPTARESHEMDFGPLFAPGAMDGTPISTEQSWPNHQPCHGRDYPCRPACGRAGAGRPALASANRGRYSWQEGAQRLLNLLARPPLSGGLGKPEYAS